LNTQVFFAHTFYFRISSSGTILAGLGF
jgi:hypothetical protein